MADRSIVIHLGAKVSGLVSGLRTATQATQDFGSRMRSHAKANSAEWERMGSAVSKAGVAMAGVLAAATVAAVKWESAWAGVLKTVDGSPEQLSRVEDGLRNLASILPASHTEIAGVAEAAGQLGIATDNVVDFTKVMIDLGETTNLSAEEAATSLARFTNIMGTSQSDVDRLGSALVGLGNNYATTESEILALSMRLAGAGRQIGLSEGQVMGLAAAMSSVGIEAEAGGSAMSLTMKRIERAVDEGGESLETFARISGMSATDFQKAWKTDAASALTTFIQGLDTAGQRGESVNGILRDLGVTGIRESDALLRLSSAGTLAFDAMTQGVEEYADATALIDEANQRYETTESKLRIAKNAIHDASIELGSTFLPVLASGAEAVASFAQGLAALPEPLHWAAGGLGAVAAAGTLATGAVLIGLPKWVEFKSALDVVASSSPRTANAITRVGSSVGKFGLRAAGVAAAGWTLVKVLDSIANSGNPAAMGIEEATSAIANSNWDDFFNDSTDSVNSFADAVYYLTDSSFDAKMNRFGTTLNKIFFGGSITDAGIASEQKMADLDAAITRLARDGNADLAAQKLREIAEIEGIGIRDLVALLPEYRNYLAEIANEADPAIQATVELAEAEIQAAEALAEWMGMVAASDASFIDLLSGYQAVIDKNIETAQATADSTQTSKDSWEDYYDGFSVGLDDYLSELEAMVAAQQDWEMNMLLLAGRVSQGVLDELASLGPDGAPLVADLVDATDDELARLEAVWGQRGVDATEAFAANLEQAGPILAQVMMVAGEEAAHAAAEALAAEETTLQDVINKYNLAFEVDAETGVAQATLNQFILDNNGRRIWFRVDAQTGGQTFHPSSGYTSWQADGSVLSFFRNGGFSENHVAQIAPAGAWRVWAEPETGGEAYIPLAASKRARSLAIWEETGKRLGAFADGGFFEPRLQRLDPLPVAAPVQRTGAGGRAPEIHQHISGVSGHEVAVIAGARVRNELQDMVVMRP